VLFSAIVIWLLATYQLFNAAYFDAVGWPEGDDEGGWLTWVCIAGLVVITIWGVIDTILRSRRV
jgi:hypothetical protein